MNAKDKLAAARFSSARLWPYFRTLVSKLQPYEAKGLGTLAVTEDWILLYDPKALDQWSVQELGVILVHEAMHPLRGHAARTENCIKRHGLQDDKASRALGNIAADAEINDDLHHLPVDHVSPKSIKAANGLTQEEYFTHLIKNNPPKGKSDVTSGQCGSGAGNPTEGEAEHAETARGEGYGRSERETAQIQRQTADQIRDAAESQPGSVPNGLLRWTDDLLGPSKIPWQQVLRRSIRNATRRVRGATQRSYRKISRKQYGLGLGIGSPRLGGLYTPQPDVSVVVDTSGSMSQDDLREAVSETAAILKATGGQVEFCACDAATEGVTKIAKPQDLCKLLTGGGGTDMGPAFAAVEKSKPNLIVCITDGEFNRVPPEPKARVIWIVVSSRSGGRFKPTYGEVIEMGEA